MKTLFPYKMVLFWNIVLVEGLQGLCKMGTIWIKDLLYVNDLAQRYKVNKTIQYIQLHYAGDRAKGIHLQFVSILNDLQRATD